MTKKQAIPEEDYRIKARESKHSKYNKSKKLVLEDIFSINDIDMVYPTDNSINRGQIKTFGKNRDKLISKFINIARETDSEIALGVALQILGGLRRSEVINLMDSSFNWTNKGLILEIRDNQKLLFPDALNTSDNQVKTQRDQVVLCPSLIKKLYEEHKKVTSKIKGANTPALFISSGTKGSITGKTYSRRFEKVKDAFLESVLKSGNQQDYLLLTSNTWSTHIGRDIFTNILLDLGLSATQVALARGDRNINSALHYVDEHTMLSTVQDAINNFRILL